MRLAIVLDDAWPQVQEAVALALRRLLPESQVALQRRQGCHGVTVHHHHLPCLFPQHGPGPKHRRVIALEPWQQAIVDAHPWDFLRGVIYTDGSVGSNCTAVRSGPPHRGHGTPVVADHGRARVSQYWTVEWWTPRRRATARREKPAATSSRASSMTRRSYTSTP